MTPRSRSSRVWIGVGGLLVAMLLGAVFTLGSLNIPFEPANANEMLVVFAVSTFIVAALLVFGLILTRALLRTWLERRAGQTGSYFKTKMVMGAMAISLLPVIVMFIASYALMNRTLDKWFPRSLEIAAEQSQALLNDLGRAENERLQRLALQVAVTGAPAPQQPPGAAWWREADAILRGADAGWIVENGEAEGSGFSFPSADNPGAPSAA
ncbi:MAG TPA: hypothetical protein VGA40_05880, partial [Candidatus Acidoferrales bacterium]